MGLTDTQAKSISRPGRYRADPTLYLNVSPRGSKNWVQRIIVAGKRRDLGLGGYPVVTLAKARQKALDNRRAFADGQDPTLKKAKRTIPTFQEAAVSTHAANRPKWRSEQHSKDWMRLLKLHAFPSIGQMAVDTITQADVLDVVVPLTSTNAETARRLRQRIKATFRWCMSYGYIATNPAGEVLDGALPALPIQRGHWRALPYRDLPAMLETIRSSKSSLAARLGFEFLVLTATRSGEVRGATWSEIKWDEQLWEIPDSRMKNNRKHRVPLSGAMMDILGQVWPLRERSDYIFPSPVKKDTKLSNMTFTKILKLNGLSEKTTVHGLRSSFRDWCKKNRVDDDAAELSLAHAIGGRMGGAYLRTDMLEERREVMEQWAEFLGN